MKIVSGQDQSIELTILPVVCDVASVCRQQSPVIRGIHQDRPTVSRGKGAVSPMLLMFFASSC